MLFINNQLGLFYINLHKVTKHLLKLTEKQYYLTIKFEKKRKNSPKDPFIVMSNWGIRFIEKYSYFGNMIVKEIVNPLLL